MEVTYEAMFRTFTGTLLSFIAVTVWVGAVCVPVSGLLATKGYRGTRLYKTVDAFLIAGCFGVVTVTAYVRWAAEDTGEGVHIRTPRELWEGKERP